MPSQITFHGKTYNSLDEMPPDERRAYQYMMGIMADKNHDGTPDIMEGGPINMLKGMRDLLADKDRDGTPDLFENAELGEVIQSSTYVVNGITYHSLDEMPPDIRERYEAAMSKVNAKQENIPDWLKEELPNAAEPPQAAPVSDAPEWLDDLSSEPITSTPLSTASIEPKGLDFRIVLIGGAVILILFVIAVALLWLGSQ